MRKGGWSVMPDRIREGMDQRSVTCSGGGSRFVWICIIRVSR
jgi:hypothetical protein